MEDTPEGGWTVSFDDFVAYCQRRITNGQLSIENAVAGMRCRKPDMSRFACRKLLAS